MGMGIMDIGIMDTCIMDVVSWMWYHGCGIMDTVSWILYPGYKILDTASWIWNHQYGMMDTHYLRKVQSGNMKVVSCSIVYDAMVIKWVVGSSKIYECF